MIQLRAAEKRGQANFGWLQSYHSFSFGSYYEPRELGHANLRVINDHFVDPGQGFGAHPHRNMEILSYLIDGTIAHKDTAGNEYQVAAGAFQLMSAGRGIAHSEFNPSKTESLNFLQIWILPNVSGTEPGYQQKAFEQTDKSALILSPNGEKEGLVVKQNALLTRVRLQNGEEEQQLLGRTENIYVHVVQGEVSINADWLLYQIH